MLPFHYTITMCLCTKICGTFEDTIQKLTNSNSMMQLAHVNFCGATLIVTQIC
jgi:hypothetical protein